MRILPVFLAGLVVAGAVHAQDAPSGSPPSGGSCPAFFRCHASHGTAKKDCPTCAKPILTEDALCNDCAYKDKVCRHCGLPRGAGGASAGPGGKDRSSPGKPRAVQKEVSINIGGSSHGEITGRFCPAKLVIDGDKPVDAIPAGRPLLVTLAGVSPEAVDGILGMLKKALGKDYPTLAIEVKGGDVARYNAIAALIKKREPKILVGGPGTIGIHDRAGITRFAASAKPADFVSGDYSKGSQWPHPSYNSGDLRMYGVQKGNFDTFFDIASGIGGKVEYPPGAGLALTAYGYSGPAVGTGPEEECFAAAVVTNFAVSHIQKKRQSEGCPLVIGPVDPALAEAFKIGNELTWPLAHPGNGDPYDPALPISGAATRNPATGVTHVILVNNSSMNVKVRLSGKGSGEWYFDPYEVKVLKY
jgi:hypothetical protein